LPDIFEPHGAQPLLDPIPGPAAFLRARASVRGGAQALDPPVNGVLVRDLDGELEIRDGSLDAGGALLESLDSQRAQDLDDRLSRTIRRRRIRRASKPAAGAGARREDKCNEARTDECRK
jgi:hypothetical protein